MITSGILNKRITIQELVTGSPEKDSFGQPNSSWDTFAQVWAAIEPIQGREFWAQQQVQSEVTIRIRIRYLSGVTSAMRVLYGSRVLTIESVIDPQEKHKEMQLMCSEGAKNE